MKKILALLLAMMLVFALAACGGSGAETPAAPEAPAAEAPAAPEAPAGETYKITFSTGETYDLPAGEDLVFFFQCDPPADMGAPEDGKEAADGCGITSSKGVVSYSDITLGGPFQYPTAELVTVTGIDGDTEITVADAVTSMGDGYYHIYFTQAEIDEAIAFNEQMAAEMAANPMPASGEPSEEDASGEPSEEASGEPSGGNAEADFEIELDGNTVTAHYADVDNGDQMTKSFVITVDGRDVAGGINKGEWVADSGDAADQAIVDAVHAAFDPNWAP